jgi:hypothetical protein
LRVIKNRKIIESGLALKEAVFNCCKHNSRCLNEVQHPQLPKCRKKFSDLESENKNWEIVFEEMEIVIWRSTIQLNENNSEVGGPILTSSRIMQIISQFIL